MNTEKEKNPDPIKDRHILIAVDESDNAKRALLYAADFMGGVPGFRATLLTVIPVPPDEYFTTGGQDRETWLAQRREKASQALEKLREVLVQSGFGEDKVATRVETSDGRPIADCILDAQKRLDCCTVILGRRGISKKEEFIYGSTSNRVLHSGKNCAVWVIE